MAVGGNRRMLYRLKPIAPDVLRFRATAHCYYQVLIHGLVLVVFGALLINQLPDALSQQEPFGSC